MKNQTPPRPLPLFPLPTVLVPGASLGLRIFEPRYLDLVRECGRNESGFGICLVIDGEATGETGAAAAYGTEALIEDFDTGDDGLLTLRVRGARRFHARQVR
ncbi:MAG: LON peptidase substrate-binding domain-containing protein, partial [Lysobacter sp.]